MSDAVLRIVVPIVGGLLTVGVVCIIVIRHRIGVLNAASRLVIFGAVVLAFEHPYFAMTLSARVIYPAAQSFVFDDHARLHFFMAGVYMLIGLVVIGVVARTLLREGRRAGWLIVFGALVVGGGLDLIVGGVWYTHGSPLYTPFDVQGDGFGWPFLYNYLFAWVAALVISYRPIFGKATLQG